MASLSERRQTVGRLREIAQVATRHGFGFVFERRALRRSAVIDDQNLPALGRHLREMLDELGPSFVKFGQLLSTRPDIVPAEILVELRQLQDAVTPFPYADVERMIEEDLRAPIDKLFTSFDPMPVAAASIGQVHLAELPSRRLVAVKVQRPGAARQIERDLALLYQAHPSSSAASTSSTSSTRSRSSTSSPGRSAASSTTGSRPVPPRSSARTSPPTGASSSPRCTAPTPAAAC